jgi:hypothetical protein
MTFRRLHLKGSGRELKFVSTISLDDFPAAKLASFAATSNTSASTFDTC